jgi:hypothetical protein
MLPEEDNQGWAELPEELLLMVLRHLQCDTLSSVSALPRQYDLAGVEWRPSNESFVSQSRLRAVRATCSGWRDVVDGNCRAMRLSTTQALEQSSALQPGGRLHALITDLQLPLYAQVRPCGQGFAALWCLLCVPNAVRTVRVSRVSHRGSSSRSHRNGWGGAHMIH